MIREIILRVGCCLLACTAQTWGDDPPRGELYGENAVAFAPSGEWLVTGGSDGNLRIRDGTTGAVRATLAGHKAGVDINTVVVSPDGRMVASASDDLSARLWDVESRAERRILRAPRAPNGFARSILTVAFAPDGRTVATGDAGDVFRDLARRAPGKGFDQLTTDDDVGHIWLWDAETGKLTGSWVADSGRVDQILFSPDGATIASVGNDTAVKLWDARTHTLQRSLPQPGQTRLHIAYAPDGKTLAASRDGPIVLWDPATGARKDCFQPDHEYGANLAFTPDGAYLAAAGAVGWSRLCSVKPRADGGNRCSAIIDQHDANDSCSALAVSPDGRWVAHCYARSGTHAPESSFRLVSIR